MDSTVENIRSFELEGIIYWVRLTTETGSVDRSIIEDVVNKGILPSALELPDNAIVFDIGAHLGSWCLPLAKARPDLRIFAFEPHPFNYGLLVRNIIQNDVPRVTALQFAISHTRGILNLLGREFNTGAWSGAPIEEMSDYYTHMIQVFALTLEDACKALNVEYPHYCKIDIEGMEYPILKQGEVLFRKGIGMDIEIHRESQVEEIESLVRSMGYKTNRDLNPLCLEARK